MREDKKQGLEMSRKDFLRSLKEFCDTGPTTLVLGDEPSPPDLDGAMVTIVIGLRGDLSLATAKNMAKKYREIINYRPMPAFISLVLLGYDEDPARFGKFHQPQNTSAGGPS